MIKIAVCMKQVPAYSEGDMDEKTGLIKRNGLETIINPYDLAALEAALQLKERLDARIDVFSMGPKRAESLIRDVYAYGVDAGYLLTNSKFGGADVLATSYTLMQGIQVIDDYDLVICGKQTTDGDTSQVGPALAKWLALPSYQGVMRILEVSDKQMKISQDLGKFIQFLEVPLPCLISVNREEFLPRMPSFAGRLQSKNKEIHYLALSDLADKDENHYGMKGSATKVKRIFPPAQTQAVKAQFLEGRDGAQAILSFIRKE
ncbi:electron transfer flavoprotein subunit beta/FixA family protein [Ohessyouella blattaphilus]|uniref:Electron transfer flavoprotein small subunit n=1 Tax=Ohessyouella blattaphilus TaxID=2949333 RepID=A0ABT1EGF3_9FIRM|nr:electron transfer flavoprotein subunit beta/FixA family protein [Ohessyouella blattaphilus]MCP1109790.1 electron transfer flavoprotein subunit beta/FixA family protein [Ohessyouella blattaphilus]MCR8563184.1 electron transfer flavoprotein subunit beta/FixA family protein [Ohessyouella blattaphilus]